MKGIYWIALTAALFSSASYANGVQKTQLQTPVNNCQGALPAYEGKIRKRPLGMTNEGTTAAFISCALSATDGDFGNEEVGAFLTNHTDAEITVSCTMVDNPVYWLWHPEVNPAPTYYPRSLTLAPRASGLLFWSSALGDGSGNFANNVNFSCSLPTGVEINYNYRNSLSQGP